MKPTTRNHYNPCFWTAHWNRAYHEQVLGGKTPADARRQPVHALSVKSNSIFTTKVENVHFDKRIGLIEITRADAEAFARRYHPDSYEEFLPHSPLSARSTTVRAST